MAIKIIKYIATNDRGYRIGESHHRSIISDKEVQEILDLHELSGWSYKQIAEQYKVSHWCVSRICRYERRAQTCDHFKKITVEVAEV